MALQVPQSTSMTDWSKPVPTKPVPTVSSSSVSGVSLNGKHEKLELDLEQVFNLVGFQLTWKSVRSYTLEHW